MAEESGEMARGILAGLHEAVSHARGEVTQVRESVYAFADAKAIRKKLRLTQAEFSAAYGIPIQSLRHWEQGRHYPDRTASAYLWTIEAFPEQTRAIQQRHHRSSASGETASVF